MRNDTIGIYRDFFNDPRAFTEEDNNIADQRKKKSRI